MYFPLATPLPTRQEVDEALPLSPKGVLQIASYRQKLERKLQGSPGFVLILGPCSIHHIESALEYGEKIASLQKELGDSVFVVMRAFLEKPRSWGGWKGFLIDPTLTHPPEIVKGIYEGRKLFLELTKMGVPIATEFLNPLLSLYTADLVTWGCIGARTASSPLHRELASYLPMPIGFKNGIDGSIELALQGITTARLPQSAILPSLFGRVELVETPGNPNTHLVLRGGPAGANFDKQTIAQIDNVKILVDCSHDNSKKDLELQKANFQEVFARHLEGETKIFGAMLESFLERGKGNSPYLSFTDPCLGWNETSDLILGSFR